MNWVVFRYFEIVCIGIICFLEVGKNVGGGFVE